MSVTKGSYTTYSLKLSGQLEKRLRDFSKLEGRSLREQLQYMLEAVLIAATQEQDFRLKGESKEPGDTLEGYVKVSLRTEVYDTLFHKAGEYGMKVTSLTRVALWMALELHEKLVPQSHLISKEAFARLIVKDMRSRKPYTVH